MGGMSSYGNAAQDHMEQTLSLDELLEINAPHTYLVRINGESMIEAGINDGDLVVVNRALNEQHRDIVIAAINGEAVVKRLLKQAGQIILHAENPKFAPRYVMEGDELVIWGVVTWNIKRQRCHG
ncbi:peptidase S24 [Halopseudomonas pelagia]|uniref:Peptidase S24 n=2 Tax=Halopseudomonas pelagia TaxID=553151 RepID=A0AA91Z642_9GAMM|nr:peptidase S24 [Halopseudomonas pelagia]QFY57619.1 peptidase S24 [Halopseudomonas pelagia]